MQIELLDCTVRDGGYINEWNFDLNTVRDMYISASKAGIHFFEIGFINKDDENILLWRRTPAWAVNKVKHGINGAKIAAMIENDTLNMEIGWPEETGIDLIRVALHKDKVINNLDKLKKYKDKGYLLAMQLMGITSYRDSELLEIAQALEYSKCVDYIYVADSYGSIMPDRLKEIVKLLKRNTCLKVGFHSHNNLQLGLANSLAAIEAGADIIDGSLYGMGRGAGDMPIELLVAYLEKIVSDKYNVLPLLECIDRNLVKLMKEYGWGYSLEYLVSGIYECHPYYTSHLVKYREYTIENILQAVKVISKVNPIGFSKELLMKLVESGFLDNKADALGDTNLVNDYLKKFDAVNISYRDRHQGRLFLVLANGPSLKSYQDKIKWFIKKHNPVVMGANYLQKLFVPDYHAFNNQRRFVQYAADVHECSRLLLGPGIKKATVTNYTNRDYEDIVCFNSSVTPFDIVNGVITSNCRTISTLLAAVAIVMGAEKIFIAGMDGYKNADANFFFYTEEDSEDREVLLEKHQSNLHYLNSINDFMEKSGKEGLHIITPTSYERLYKGIDNYL